MRGTHSIIFLLDYNILDDQILLSLNSHDFYGITNNNNTVLRDARKVRRKVY